MRYAEPAIHPNLKGDHTHINTIDQPMDAPTPIQQLLIHVLVVRHHSVIILCIGQVAVDSVVPRLWDEKLVLLERLPAKTAEYETQQNGTTTYS